MTPFTITDVGTILGIERLPGGDEASYNVVCPFAETEEENAILSYIKKVKWRISIIVFIVMRREIC